jgi:hypothetical protein
MGHLPNRNIYYFGGKKAPRMDVLNGEVDGSPIVAPGRKCHQMIEVLLRDFYQPMRLASVFSEVFPGDHFDPDSSPNRTHQILNRTRNWLRSGKIPVEIGERAGFYSLRIVGNFSFKIPLERKPVEGMHLHFDKLKAVLGDASTFSAREARERLEISRQTVQRIVNWGIKVGKLERVGTSKDTVYRWAA